MTSKLRIKKLSDLKFLLFLAFFALPANAFAQPKIDGVVEMIYRGLRIAISVSGLVAVAMIIYAGYMWMISGGDAQKKSTAQGTLTWAVIGLVFLFIFWMFFEPLFSFLGA